jgi:hypothetical protein
MPGFAIARLSSIPEFEETNKFYPPPQQVYPLRRSPSFLSLSTTTPFQDISPGRSQVCLTFHLLQPGGAAERSTQYMVDRLSKWSHLIGHIERTVCSMGGFNILKIYCTDGHDVRRTLRRGERVWERCSRTNESDKFREQVKIEVVLSSKS